MVALAGPYPEVEDPSGNWQPPARASNPGSLVRIPQSTQPLAAAIVQAALAAPVLLALAMPATVLHGQVRAGGQATYQSQLFDGAFGAGVRAEVDLAFLRPGLIVAGTWDRFFPDCDDCRFTDIGGELLMAPQGPLYLGLGVSHRQFQNPEATGSQSGGDDDDSSEWNYVFTAGIRLSDFSMLVPFLEFRQEFGSDSLNEQIYSLGLMISPPGRRRAPQPPPMP